MEVMANALESRINTALEKVRPFLNKDGGDIELVEVAGDRVYVKLHGNCNGCPMSLSTIKLGVESTIKDFAPEIREVVSID